MAPIPQKQKRNLLHPVPAGITTADIETDNGMPLNRVLYKQKRTNTKHADEITINSQHVTQYESKVSSNTLVYRDVFPGRKYKLTMSDTTWMGGDNKVTIGYTVGDTFTQISQTATAPDDNVFKIELPIVAAIDKLEVRMTGASSAIRGYLEDATTSDSISGSIARILQSIADLISGQNDIKGDVRDLQTAVGNLQTAVGDLQTAVGDLQTSVGDLDQRVTALEEEITPTT